MGNEKKKAEETGNTAEQQQVNRRRLKVVERRLMTLRGGDDHHGALKLHYSPHKIDLAAKSTFVIKLLTPFMLPKNHTRKEKKCIETLIKEQKK